ncbi:Uncharacterized protein OS=Singulisphaera acidiphila (strain ATCC BAA-1392 / DSM 18658 / VKM B-2454 / MOB10) GN=Sinac_4595 PE=4 SV=1 [Gemmata massiliana]|uniref:DUF3352 domain-containing protein n=1 Tax=Gemmata massiliana TaxID=1210884 RepID=A0A6P2DEE3_9BACT|nr:hypothetical protein [Gemmata massiliana]VTR99039.1 Uncharacterized protein OS=Singulisphaera acidiphila (strain ATCC BAA-1392 / DSM 18658 / VKM B-2454 / MOB10) GN=Sinac_4595 PE=4 SV=1 [Gemmata massiliana]
MSLLFRAAVAAAVIGTFAAFVPASPAAAPVPPDGGKAVTFPFPAKAPIVVQVTGVGAARERLSALLKTAFPDAAQIDKQIDSALKELLADRKLTAVPKDGRVYFVVNNIASLTENNAAISVLVPVTSYKEFRATFLTADERKTFEEGKGVDEVKLTVAGEEHAVHVVDLKEYVAISPDKTTAEVYATKFTRASTTAMPVELAKSFVGSDVGLYVNFDVINEVYGEQIRGFKGLVDFGFQQAQMGGMLPGLGKKQLEAVKSMAHGLFQAVGDCRGLVVGVEFRPEGLNLRVQAQFAENTESVKLLKAEMPGALVDIGKLPAGLAQYGASKVGTKFSDAVRGLNPEFAPADDDTKGNEAIEKRWAEIAAAGPQGEVSGTAGADSSITVTKYVEPKKAVDARLGCYEAMAAGGRIHSAVLKDAPKVKKDARKHAGFTFAEVQLAFDFEATVKDLPEGAKEVTLEQLKRSVPEKMALWIGTDGKTVVQVVAKDWAAATAALDGYRDNKKPVGETDGFKLTRKQLPTDASVLTMMEVGQAVTGMVDSLRALQDTIPGFPRIGKVPPVSGPPAFIGVAVTLKDDTATLNVFVPGAALAAGRKIVSGLLTNLE